MATKDRPEPAQSEDDLVRELEQVVEAELARPQAVPLAWHNPDAPAPEEAPTPVETLRRKAVEAVGALQSALYGHLPVGLAIKRGQWLEEMKRALGDRDAPPPQPSSPEPVSEPPPTRPERPSRLPG